MSDQRNSPQRSTSAQLQISLPCGVAPLHRTVLVLRVHRSPRPTDSIIFDSPSSTTHARRTQLLRSYLEPRACAWSDVVLSLALHQITIPKYFAGTYVELGIGRGLNRFRVPPLVNDQQGISQRGEHASDSCRIRQSFWQSDLGTTDIQGKAHQDILAYHKYMVP